jgi:hypothetical protein
LEAAGASVTGVAAGGGSGGGCGGAITTADGGIAGSAGFCFAPTGGRLGCGEAPVVDMGVPAAGGADICAVAGACAEGGGTLLTGGGTTACA